MSGEGRLHGRSLSSRLQPGWRGAGALLGVEEGFGRGSVFAGAVGVEADGADSHAAGVCGFGRGPDAGVVGGQIKFAEQAQAEADAAVVIQADEGAVYALGAEALEHRWRRDVLEGEVVDFEFVVLAALKPLGEQLLAPGLALLDGFVAASFADIHPQPADFGAAAPGPAEVIQAARGGDGDDGAGCEELDFGGLECASGGAVHVAGGVDDNPVGARQALAAEGHADGGLDGGGWAVSGGDVADEFKLAVVGAVFEPADASRWAYAALADVGVHKDDAALGRKLFGEPPGEGGFAAVGGADDDNPAALR